MSDIAASLDISVPTLRKHYFAELSSQDAARAQCDGELIDLLWRLAAAGKVTAIDRLAARIGSQPGGAAGEKLGKKEEANRRAAESLKDPEWGDLRIQ